MADILQFEDQDSRMCERGIDQHTGTRTWVCPYSDRDASWVPVPGISRYTDGLGLASSWRDSLICTKVKESDSWGASVNGVTSDGSSDPGWVKIVVSYSTAPELDGGYKVTRRSAGKMMEIGVGQIWASDGQVSDQPYAIPVPGDEMVVSCIQTYDEYFLRQLFKSEGSINKFGWCPPWGMQYDSECVMFKNFESEDWIDKNRGIHLIRLSFIFHCQPWSHLRVWRSYPPNISITQGDVPGFGMVSTGGKWDQYVDDPFPQIDYSQIWGGRILNIGVNRVA